MVCSLNCFCDFLEAKTPEKRAAVVRQYKKTTSAPMKGMTVYYQPVLGLIKGTLCPNGTQDEKLAALRKACIMPTWTDKLNDARIASNTRVYKAFCSEFASKTLSFFSSPRMQFLASKDVAVNLQPELYLSVDGSEMMWKFGMSKRARPERIIRIILQLMSKASRHKGLSIPMDKIRFLDTMTGKTYQEEQANSILESEVVEAAKALAEVWEAE